ncbi:MAG: GIY-YIG nuclease family protein [Phenylobacterium sp.]|nr:GIY-YIG nuclease family protein [Phenylobacterium sp.]THD60636.1 MAG: GIY-YIG nuclease family protein [Phenylobacterium sp.]
MSFYVYILASRRNGTLYIGQTLPRRALEHRDHVRPSFTERYGVTQLVHYETFETRDAARAGERAMKHWRRLWKLELIERFNPAWRDLYEDLEPTIR